MKALLDNALSPKLVQVLAELDPGIEFDHMRTRFLAHGADEDWMPRASADGWVVITKDRRSARRPGVVPTFRAQKIGAVHLPVICDNMALPALMDWLRAHYHPGIRRALERAQVEGRIFLLDSSGHATG